MKKITAMLLVLIMLGTAAVALASAKTVTEANHYAEYENYPKAYKFMLVTGDEAIPAREKPQAGSSVVGYAQPGELIGCIYWWSDNQWIMVYYNNGQSAGWMHVDDLK